MTSPAAIVASFVQPAAKLAMGDAVGGAVGGFEALLAVLTQSLQGGVEGQATEAAAETDTPAETGDLAALLGADGAAAWQAHLLTRAPAAAEDGATPVTCDARPTKGSSADPLTMLGQSAEAAAETAPGAGSGLESGYATLDALLSRQAREPIDPAILERFKPQSGQTVAQPPLAPVPADVDLPAAVAQVAAQVGVEQAKAATGTVPAETVAAPAVVPPPVEVKAPVPPRKSAATDNKTAKAEASDATPAPVKVAETDDAAEVLSEETAPAPVAAYEAETQQAPAHNTDATVQTLTAKLETFAAGATAFAAQVRGAPETVAKLAAGILDKLDGKATRFDLELDPHGLGKVDVSVEIASDGKLTAQLGFDSALGLSELRSRAQELRTALEQAGFSLADNALSFDFSGERRQQTADSQSDRSDQAGKAFARAQGALDEELAAAPTRYQARRGLDLLI